ELARDRPVELELRIPGGNSHERWRQRILKPWLPLKGGLESLRSGFGRDFRQFANRGGCNDRVFQVDDAEEVAVKKIERRQIEIIRSNGVYIGSGAEGA